MQRRLMLVDESRSDREEVCALLKEPLGVEIEEVEDAQQALEALRERPVDLIVTELVSSEDEGLELVKALHDEFPSIPIVLVTARGNEEIVVRALRAGAASYVPKLLLSQYLVEVVGALLEAAESRRKRSRALRSLVDSRSVFVLENDRRLFGPLIGYLRETLAGLGVWDDGHLTHISVALEEALVNAAEHGNLELESELREDREAYHEIAESRRTREPWAARRVRLEVFLTPDRARFVIEDQGSGFDPKSLPDPTDPENLLRPSGRGVLLMRALMDEVEFNEQGNVVTLLKNA